MAMSELKLISNYINFFQNSEAEMVETDIVGSLLQ